MATRARVTSTGATGSNLPPMPAVSRFESSSWQFGVLFSPEGQVIEFQEPDLLLCARSATP